MPRPLYIICSESGTEDARSGVLSLFNILEKVQATKVETEAVPPGTVLVQKAMPVRVTAVWTRTDDDPPGCDLESEIVLYLPADGQEIIGGKATFKYEEGKPLHRLSLLATSDLFNGPGILRAVSRIRRVGETEWKTMEYPVIVEEVTTPDDFRSQTQASRARSAAQQGEEHARKYVDSGKHEGF